MEQTILRSWRRLGLCCGTTVVAGFSGGPDSLALAIALGRMVPLGLFEPILVHVDHRLRDGSADDADQAEGLAAGLGLP
ncbi:MAG: hypothetical protein H0U40_10475, partial [Chloroflexia bacterium]|nr:hypothetical protein [Chloroflexia bacterium]